MVDRSFFKYNGPFNLSELAAHLGFQLDKANNIEIRSVASIENAISGDICFYDDTSFGSKKNIEKLAKCKATACIIKQENLSYLPNNIFPLISDNPYLYYAKIAGILYSEYKEQQSELVSSSALLDKTAYVAPGVFIGPGAKIGPECYIEPGVVIGRSVEIGRGSFIGANSVIKYAKIGEACKIYPGVLIGQDGFGFTQHVGKHVPIPQLGRVIIGNEVHIGAGSSIDRGALDDTIIGDNCMIDNLVQIGHNVQFGRGCIVCGMVGIAGSTKFGNYVTAGGQSGFSNYLNIGDGAKIAAKSGVMNDIPAGATFGGSPAMKIKDWHRQSVALRRLARSKVKEDHE